MEKQSKFSIYTTDNEKRWFFGTGAVAIVCIVVALVFLILALVSASGMFTGNYSEVKRIEFYRATTAEEEGYDDEYTKCQVEFLDEDETYSCLVEYKYEDWEELADDEHFLGYVYLYEGDQYIASKEALDESGLRNSIYTARTDAISGQLNVVLSIGLVAIGFVVMSLFGRRFSLYEKCWFLGIMIMAAVVAILFPESEINGVSGIVIMGLYLLDTFLNILCELLISKQSKWNFIVSLFVEFTEIAICIVLAYRFATMASTLLFWIPCDIISFINWHRHPDKIEEELTVVRRLKGWQEVLILAGIAVWTVGIGYLLTLMDFGTELFNGNQTAYIVTCYMDACVTAVGICNGLFILFRFREQWIAWYIDAVLEAVINILSGQYVLLVLKLGYFTNTTYGYIRWTKYIHSREAVPAGAEISEPKP
ncbi:MAG: nicotinamide mononucleotide transporter [Clostridia bacterium]|nr:nicotinamide mononucleotide transporter [Clostridia bacterium]